jgi:hypothetical protein
MEQVCDLRLPQKTHKGLPEGIGNRTWYLSPEHPNSLALHYLHKLALETCNQSSHNQIGAHRNTKTQRNPDTYTQKRIACICMALDNALSDCVVCLWVTRAQ